MMADEPNDLLKRLKIEKQELFNRVPQSEFWFACFIWNGYFEDFRILEPYKGYEVANEKLKEYVDKLKG